MKNAIRTALFCAGLALSVAVSGCSNQKPAPLYASSSAEAGYAERYPDELASARGRFVEHESKSRRMLQSFSTYPDEVKDPSWPVVLDMVKTADTAGRSAAYVERLAEVEGVTRFFDDEKEEISKNVAGAASYAAKQKGCKDVDAYGSASHALEKSVEKQLEKRLRERNDAQRVIDDNQEALKKENIEKLRKQADDIAYVSYMTHVGVAQSKERMEALVAEASDVQKTLDRTIEQSNKVAADAGRSAGDKAAAQKRAETAAASKQRIESELQQADHTLKELEQRTKQIQDEYDQALKGLEQKIEEKAKAQPAKAASLNRSVRRTRS
jgi:hypothetical protein